MDAILTPEIEAQRIGLLLINGFSLMSYASTTEPMRAANLLSEQNLYDIEHLTCDGEAVSSSGGLKIEANKSIDHITSLDYLIVIASGNPVDNHNEKVNRFLRRITRSKTTIIGVSAAPFILADAGIMEKHRMTIHWEHAESLLEKHPDLLLSRSLYTIDRTRITCAGGTAPLDMMHALITEHHGSLFARRVSDWFMHTEVRPAGGQQKSGLVERYRTHNAKIIETIEIMENHLADPLTLDQLASLGNRSKRQLCRDFVSHMGIQPMRFYRDLRLELAKRLCEQTTLSLSEIALATGFANASHFATSFKDKFQKTPSEIRH